MVVFLSKILGDLKRYQSEISQTNNYTLSNNYYKRGLEVILRDQQEFHLISLKLVLNYLSLPLSYISVDSVNLVLDRIENHNY